MHGRIASATVGGVLLFITAPGLAQTISPADHWNGEISGLVDRVEGSAVVLTSGRAYRYRTDVLREIVGPGDSVRLHRDYIIRGTETVYVQRGQRGRRWFGRGLADLSRAESDELEAARAQCRADWPADFVMQRYCIERQEEAYYDLRGRGR